MHNTTEIPVIEKETVSTTSPYFEVAVSIGRKLAKDAIWSEDGRCNWLGASIETINGQYQMIQRTFKSDIYSGLSGIALFLAELSIRVIDPVIQHVLNGALRSIQWQLKNQKLDSSFGFYSGKLGAGYALWKIGHLISDNNLKETGLNEIRKLRDIEIPIAELDVITGPAGAIPALLEIYKTENDHVFIEIAVKCGDYLINRAVKTPTAWSWEIAPGIPGLTGYSHGAAGIALALLELYENSNSPIYLEGAMKGFQHERIHYNPHHRNWPDLRKDNPTQEVSCGEMWCHGAPGIALSRLRAYELTKDISFLKEAEIAFDTTYQSIIRSLQNPNTANYSLCHGLAGNADILISASSFLNNPTYFQVAQQVGLTGIALYKDQTLDWPSGVNDPTGDTISTSTTPGLMLGTAGTGYFYLRLAFPNELKSILFI